MATLQSKSPASTASRCLLAVAAGLLLAGAAHAQTKNSCLECHSILTDNLGVTEEKFSQDVHAQKGLTCASCHGGDASNDDPEIAMGKKAGFKGKISHAQIPQLCGSCHSDPDVMRKYNPGLRTDQLSQYHTSVHGKLLAKGDGKVAVCVDCHSVHDIRPPSDPRSTVNPVNVPATCSRCHSDAERMKEYKIPTNQFAEYKKSVHHEALTVRGDLSAPTCVTCHGNHGATPPGASSVAAVCSTCHVFQAQLFDASPHKAAFASAGLPGCVTCHSNHGIQHPNDTLIGTDDKAVCGQCHTEGDPGFVAANSIRDHLAQLAAAIDRSDQILSQAERSGMEVSQARLDLVQARDTLTKARVTIHSANVARVQQDIQPGLASAAKNYEAGKDALKERNYRRFGLGLSLIAIGIVLTGLRMYLKQIESGQNSQAT
jgi:predicted CXXCH cytochrome family protein